MAQNDIDPIARSTSHPRKTIITIFFSIKGIALIDILLENAKLSSDELRENIVKEFDLIIYPTGRKLHNSNVFKFQ
jgi:hypothetical protein